MSKRPAEEQLTKESVSAANGGDSAAAFTLYGDGFSTSTQRVLLTALELGLAYDFRLMDCMKGVDTKAADYLAIDPFGRVPAAVVDGVTMYESRAIARMLADKFQSRASQLLPTDFKGRALFEQWASLEVTTYAPKVDAINAERVWYPMFGAPGDEQKAAALYTNWQPHLAILDKQLEANEYITGELSLVDLFLAPDWSHLTTTVEGKALLERYTNIAAWWTRLTSRQSWQALQPIIKGTKESSKE